MDQPPWSTGMLVLLMEPEPQILDLMEPVQFIQEEPWIIWTCFFSWDKESQTGSCQMMQEVLILWSPSDGSGWRWRWTRNQDLFMMHLTGSDIKDCLMNNFYLMFYHVNKYNRHELTLMPPYSLYGINVYII